MGTSYQNGGLVNVESIFPVNSYLSFTDVIKVHEYWIYIEYKVVQKKENCLKNSKNILMKSSAIYIHNFSRSKSSLNYVEKSDGALKFSKMTCSKLVKNIKKHLSRFFSILKLLQRRHLL